MLNGKVVHLVTDNASNMKKAIYVFNTFHINTDEGNDESDDNADDISGLDDDSAWQDLNEDDNQIVQHAMQKCCTSRLACFAHTLQLTVRDGLEKTSSGKGQKVKIMMGKCVKVASLCYQSAQFREVFERKFGSG